MTADFAERLRNQNRSSDYRDLAVETLADSEAALMDRVTDLEQDIAIYRSIAIEALHALHYVTRQRDRLREQIRVWLKVSRDEMPS